MVTVEVRWGHQIPKNCSPRWLWAITYLLSVLRTKDRYWTWNLCKHQAPLPDETSLQLPSTTVLLNLSKLNSLKEVKTFTYEKEKNPIPFTIYKRMSYRKHYLYFISEQEEWEGCDCFAYNWFNILQVTMLKESL